MQAEGLRSASDQAPPGGGDGHLHHVLGALCDTAGERGDGEEEGSVPLHVRRLLLGMIPLRELWRNAVQEMNSWLLK
jgi:hypothetical protein